MENMKLSKAVQFIVILMAFLVLGISFKVMVLVEGLTEVRPVNAIPVVAGLTCGTIGALACSIGNLLADMVGTFSPYSALGVIANFTAAYLPYRLWYTFSEKKPDLHSGKNLFLYCLTSLLGAMAAAWILSFGMYVFGGGWVKEIYFYVFFNNFAFSIGFGMPILIILTSDGINMECCKPPKRYWIIGKRQTRKAVCLLFLCLMLLLLAAVLIMGTGPDEAGWMLPLSAAALTALLGQLI